MKCFEKDLTDWRLNHVPLKTFTKKSYCYILSKGGKMK